LAKRIGETQLQQLIEGALFVADKPLTVAALRDTVLCEFAVTLPRIREMLETLQQHYAERGINLVEVASGYRFQSAPAISPFLSYLWTEKAPRYSRAILETLALIAYRQPITRAEIEAVRGVSVSTQIIKTLQERSWIKVIGHKEVPGRPALYATTPEFLDYFSMKSLSELPELPDEDEKLSEESGNSALDHDNAPVEREETEKS